MARKPTEAGAALARDLASLRHRTAWERGVEAGDVAAKPSKRFEVEVVGVTDVVTEAATGVRTGRPLNKPVYATLATVTAVLLGWHDGNEVATASDVQRLREGGDVYSFANRYRLVERSAAA